MFGTVKVHAAWNPPLVCLAMTNPEKEGPPHFQHAHFCPFSFRCFRTVQKDVGKLEDLSLVACTPVTHELSPGTRQIPGKMNETPPMSNDDRHNVLWRRRGIVEERKTWHWSCCALAVVGSSCTVA